ncbi:Cupin domain-containing protein [Cladophialophora immunda]|nr:Cupin domain-containing protein [Cladophialophora immunda]
MSTRDSLPTIHRFITTHSTSGESLLDTTIPSEALWRGAPEASFFLAYTTKTFPVVLKGDADLDDYTNAFASTPKLTISGGTVLRVMDLGPGISSPMHRTVSVEYTIVMEGEVELELDSSTKQVMRRGDICIQRATNHSWRNMSDTEWARIFLVHIDSEKPVVGGKEVGASIEGRDVFSDDP